MKSIILLFSFILSPISHASFDAVLTCRGTLGDHSGVNFGMDGTANAVGTVVRLSKEVTLNSGRKVYFMAVGNLYPTHKSVYMAVYDNNGFLAISANPGSTVLQLNPKNDPDIRRIFIQCGVGSKQF